MSNPTGGNRPEVVIVEDVDRLASLYEDYLSGKYNVKVANTGEEALTVVSRSTDVILLDRKLPGRSGDEILGELRDIGNDAPVAMVSAVDPGPELFKLDVEEYLEKPVSKEELVNLVEKLLTRESLDDRMRDYLSLVDRKKMLEESDSVDDLHSDKEYNFIAQKLQNKREELVEHLATGATFNTSPFDHYSWRQKIWTGIAICIPAVLLVLIHTFFPTASTELLQNGGPESNLVVGYALSFVHMSDGHLYGNIGGYLTISFLTLILCIRLINIKWFYVTSILLLTVLPLLTNLFLYDLLNILYGPNQVQFVGFSHIVSGFVGYSLVVFISSLRLIYTFRSVLFITTYIILQTAGVIFYLNGSDLFLSIFVGCLLAVGLFISDQIRLYINGDEELSNIVENTVVVTIFGVVYTVGGLGIVPTTNIEMQFGVLSHLLGVVLGFAIAILTAFALNVYPIKERLKSKGYTIQTSTLF